MIRYSTKIRRAEAMGQWFKGAATSQAVMEQIPAAVVAECPARIIAAVGDAINAAYHAGKATMGAEVIDGTFVWVDCLGVSFDLAELREIASQRVAC